MMNIEYRKAKSRHLVSALVKQVEITRRLNQPAWYFHHELFLVDVEP